MTAQRQISLAKVWRSNVFACSPPLPSSFSAPLSRILARQELTKPRTYDTSELSPLTQETPKQLQGPIAYSAFLLPSPRTHYSSNKRSS